MPVRGISTLGLKEQFGFDPDTPGRDSIQLLPRSQSGDMLCFARFCLLPLLENIISMSNGQFAARQTTLGWIGRLAQRFKSLLRKASCICCQYQLCSSLAANVCGMTLDLCCLQSVLSQPSMPACLFNHELAVGDVLGNAAASGDLFAPGNSFLRNFQSLDRDLQQPGASTDEAAGSRAGQDGNSPSEGMRLFGICSTDGYKLLQDAASIVGSGPGWRLGSEGSTGQPQGRNASPAPLSALSGFGANNSTSSSGSQGSAQLQSGPTRDGTACACTRQRSSRRLASKQAHHATQDSLSREPAERNPEAGLKLKEVLDQTLSDHKQRGAAQPHRVSGHLGSDPGAKQPLQEGSWRPHSSSSKGPAPCDTKAVLTLDQALDSMSATQSFSLGLYNPFAAAAAGSDSTWQIPSRAEGSEGRDGRASSCSTVTCDQDQLAFGLPQQVCHVPTASCLLASAGPAEPALPALHALPAGLFRHGATSGSCKVTSTRC